MPRRQFLADLQLLLEGNLPEGICDLKRGEDDGQINFRFHESDDALIEITALIPDISDYPGQHNYVLFANENAPTLLATQLQNAENTDGKPLSHMLEVVSKSLRRTSPEGFRHILEEDNGSELLSGSEDGGMDVSDGELDLDFDTFTGQCISPSSAHELLRGISSCSRTLTPHEQNRIYQDLGFARAAGFKVSSIGHLLDGGSAFVSLSVRVAKLGISADAMEAWQIMPNDYLLLLIHYQQQYLNYEDLVAAGGSGSQSGVRFRICASKRYKPTLHEAVDAFQDPNDSKTRIQMSTSQSPEVDIESDRMRTTFISKSLETMFEERLLQILRFRGSGMSWRGAEDWQRELQGSMSRFQHHDIPRKHFMSEPFDPGLPAVVTSDHYSSGPKGNLSFPLLTMQYTLRHFVRCTEFCLVCHRQLATDIEAIKPYVCDEPLCLYQYMALGFGPSIEHEIVTQPNVIDLLVSFCYSSAANFRMRDFPIGLGLMVPPVPEHVRLDAQLYMPRQVTTKQPQTDAGADSEHDAPTWDVGYDSEAYEMIFFVQPTTCPVRTGSWIVLTAQSPSPKTHQYHCRVRDATYFPTILLGEPILLNLDRGDASADGQPSPSVADLPKQNLSRNWRDYVLQIYDRDFETFDDIRMCNTIRTMLDTLPSIGDLKAYIELQTAPNLSKWADRVSPAALSLLRWIIASNRACIVEVNAASGTLSRSSASERVHGMQGYIQFRFAMGAPDKEHRFISAVRGTARRLQLSYPTIFAWHGSPLHNWHSIIREGLHFRDTAHGRAYGDGVYHARDVMTSTGYSHGGNSPRGEWSQSALTPQQVVALNEIVNAPQEFVSSRPYYVVKQLDWIQTRYLFVKASSPNKAETVDVRPLQPYSQDPTATPTGLNKAPIVIPAAAIKWKRTLGGSETPPSSLDHPSAKRRRTLSPASVDDLTSEDWDNDSIATDADDVAFFSPRPDKANDDAERWGQHSHYSYVLATNDDQATFKPSVLDLENIPLMPLPENASSTTTRRLMRELQHLQNTQKSGNAIDLGWYIDVDKIENAYQWIVQLHSFHRIDSKLPLLDDMKKKGVTSIVMEIRFQHDFPFSPPYARIIRPRFRTLANGGGGHIVMGGAMCMELLTNTGWSSASSMESVLMQIRLAIASDPPARIDFSQHGDYGLAEAADGYIRACRAHGWVVPPGFQNMAHGINQTTTS